MKNLSIISITLFLFSFFTQCKECINREFEDAKLNRLSIEEVMEKLGEETSITDFSLSYNMPEYRKGLLALVIVKNMEGEMIKEYAWEVSDCKKTYVWFREINNEWISTSNLSYNPQKVNY